VDDGIRRRGRMPRVSRNRDVQSGVAQHPKPASSGSTRASEAPSRGDGRDDIRIGALNGDPTTTRPVRDAESDGGTESGGRNSHPRQRASVSDSAPMAECG
jgi:hypothetical protein